MNHVFLFQVHKEPELLERILTRLDAANHFFVINVDAKAKFRLFEHVLKRHTNILNITRYNVMHGGFSQVECTIKQMEYCIGSGKAIHYFHTVSGQDYPCVSTEVFDAWFEQHMGRSFTMMDLLEQALEWRKDKYRLRLERWNYADIFHSNFCRKLHMNGIAKRLTGFIVRPYSGLDMVWGGWNWFSLTENVVRYLLEYFNKNPDYLKRFRYTDCCDELAFSTVLYYLRDELNIETRNSLRYIEWHPKRECDSPPLVLDEREYKDIVDSGAFFCRKVESEKSVKLLDMLDQRIAAMDCGYVPTQNPKYP